MDASLVGKLLIAGPRLIDPNFFRSVLLVCDHNEDGALGLVLNRPSDIAVGDHLPGWVERLAPPDVVFSGGPVQPATALGLGRCDGTLPPGWSAVVENLGLVDLSLPPAEVVGDLRALRVYSGYSGWGTQQLETEIASGDWLVTGVETDDVFGADPDGLWRRSLRRQGGGVALYADFPLDPGAN